jgi:hypothetical protein
MIAAGGIAGTPAEVRAWLPGAMAIFTFSLHTTATHEIRFTGADTATGRVHVFNRNGVEWEGAAEIFDVSAVYDDTYRRVGDAWRIAGRIERTLCLAGGRVRRCDPQLDCRRSAGSRSGLTAGSAPARQPIAVRRDGTKDVHLFVRASALDRHLIVSKTKLLFQGDPCSADPDCNLPEPEAEPWCLLTRHAK